MNGKNRNHEQLANNSTKSRHHFPWLPATAIILLAMLFFQYNQQPKPSDSISEKATKNAIVLKEPEQSNAAPNEVPSQTKTEQSLVTTKSEPVNKQKNSKINSTAQTKKTTKDSSNNSESSKDNTAKQINKSESVTAQSPEGISLASLSLENKANIRNSQKLKAAQQQHPSTLKNQATLNTSIKGNKQLIVETDPNVQCLKRSYLNYYQQKISTNKWLREHITALNPNVAKQAHYEYEQNKQRLDDEKLLTSALFEISPSQINTSKSFELWLPKIDEQLRRELCRYNDLTCQAAIRYSVPTHSLDTQQQDESSSYLSALNQVMASDEYYKQIKVNHPNCS